MANDAKQSNEAHGPSLEEEFETWYWAKTSGVSPEELRKALQDELSQETQNATS